MSENRSVGGFVTEGLEVGGCESPGKWKGQNGQGVCVGGEGVVSKQVG